MSDAPGSGSNPLLDGLRIEPTPDPTTLVIFGASGDLTRRKLLPALYQLSRGQRLPARFSVIGVARSEMNDDEFRRQFHDSLKEFAGVEKADEVSGTLVRGLSYLFGEMDDPALYARLARTLQESHAPDGVLFYLAIPPTVYGKVVEQLGAAGLTRPSTPTGWRRVIVEKPFGTDLDSARALNAVLHQHLEESQIFRIDITWERRPSRTCSCSALRTACSSRSGTGATSITCKSPRQKRLAWSVAPRITSRPARCATWSRTT